MRVEWHKPGKMDLLLVASSLVLESGNAPMLDEVTLTPKASVHSSGICLDAGLLLEALVARSAYHQLKLLYQLCAFLNKKDLAMFTDALVISSLDYCNALYP